MLDPTERFLYVHEGDKVSVVKVADGQRAGQFGIGSVWRKMGFTTNTGFFWIHRGGTIGDVTGSQEPEATPVDTMAFAPSGKHVFVFNSHTRDLTIVETTTFKSLAKVGTGSVGPRDFFWRMPGGKHLLALKDKRAIVFDTEAGNVAADRTFDDSLVTLVPSMAMLLVRTSGGTALHRVSPFEVARDFGPECALGAQAIRDKANGFVVNVDARRFLLSSAKGVRLYDFDFKLLTEIDGLGSPADLYFVETAKVDVK